MALDIYRLYVGHAPHAAAAREILFMGKTQDLIDDWPTNVSDIIKTNLQALQGTKCHAFSELPDWTNQGKVTDKPLKGGNLKGTHQLTVKYKDSYRVVYVACCGSEIFVLHAFMKKTEGKSNKHMEIGTSRVSYIVNGQVSKFTVDKLIELLGKIGYSFNFELRDGVPTFQTSSQVA